MRRIFCVILAAALGLFVLPFSALAQPSEPPPIPGGPYVPVVDVWVNVALSEFLLTNPDSLRNILGGSGLDENGEPAPVGAKYYPDINHEEDPNYPIPEEICKLKNPWDAPMSWVQASGLSEATENTPWYRATTPDAIDSTETPAIDVLEFPDIKVNDSTSLSCLLQELVEWKKLELFLTIHNMIREYISDVQAQQLSMKLEGLIAKANTDWARQGIERCVTDGSTGDTTCTTYSVTGTQPTVLTLELTEARSRTITGRVAGDVNTPEGFTNSCNSYKLDMAGDLAEEAANYTTDPLDSMAQYTQCGLTNELDPASGIFETAADADDWAAGNFDQGQYGGWMSWFGTLSNSANSRLTAQTDLSVMQTRQLAEVREEFELERLAPGTLPAYKCSGQSNDPNCDPRYVQIETNQQMISDRINAYASFGDRAIADADSLDDYTAEGATNQSIELLTQGGFEGYNTGRIADLKPPIDEYIREFYTAIEWGYFDLYEETQDWAQGALLNIYDTMSFSANLYENNQAIPELENSDDLYDVY